MIRRRDILGVAVLSAFLGAVLGLFLFGSLGGEVSPGRPAAAGLPSGTVSPASLEGSSLDQGAPLTTTTFSSVAEKVIPAIVTITSEKTVKVTSGLPFGDDPFMRRFFGNPFGEQQPRDQEVRGLGSGVIVSPDGYILTNNHVVNEADKVQVRLDEHTTLDARVIGTDPQTDVAVLKVDASDLPHVEFGDSDRLKVGEWVVAVGSPFGLARSVTVGIVSAKGRSNVGVTGANGYEDFIQTDAAINHGNSGGALVNLNGDLVGINTAIASSTGGSNGVGFAIPVNMAQNIMDSLIRTGKVTRGWIGVNIQTVNDQLAKGLGLSEAKGVVISGVQKNTPAERAGLRSNDVILAMNGKPVEDNADLRNRVAATPPGTTVELEILRDGRHQRVSVKLEELPRNLAQRGDEDQEDSGGGSTPGEMPGSEEKLGLAIRTVTPEVAQKLKLDDTRGVVVTGVEPGSPAAEAGLAPNDVILEVNRQSVSSVEQFRKALGKPSKGESVVLRVIRGDSYLFLVLEM